MNRYVTILGVFVAALSIIFYFAHIADAAQFILLAIAILLVGIGSLTGT